ncbi:hypothetical protein CRE_16906 [Caenorhabditis remanei]|uniref:Major sperm protein n=1 Tax=Caenorhabditis remanei TaxID=31234 RepID=E3MSB4_CAERE|nr:hypothetical protein CRE_16906 [Caenorhabditis remanei]
MNDSKKKIDSVFSILNSQLKYLLFAGRRIEYLGNKCLILIKPHSGRHFYVEEKKLNNSYVYLGSFLFARRTTRRVLYDFEPTDKPKKFNVKVEGDVAFIENLQCELVEEDGLKLFKGKTLGDILCKEPLELGQYFLRVHLMSQATVTKDKRIIHFEGTNLSHVGEKTESSVSPFSSNDVEPTGEIETQPSSKLVVNAPFDPMNTYYFKIINAGEHQIGVGIKTNNRNRFEVEPKFGVIDPNESILVSMKCSPFPQDSEEESVDKITIGWINAPVGAGKEFKREWFRGDTVVQNRSLFIEYNK